MSEFLKSLRKSINDTKTDLKTLAEAAGVSVNTVKDYLSGKKIPKHGELVKMLVVIEVSDQDKIDILNEFKMYDLGISDYKSGVQLNDVLKGYKRWVNEEYRTGTVYEDIKIRELYSEQDIIDAFMSIIDREKDEKDSMICMNHFSMGVSLKRILLREKHHFHVKEYITLNRGEKLYDYASYNIISLESIIPYALRTNYIYDVYYSYLYMTPNDSYMSLFPHYMVTHHHVILLSGDESYGVLIHDEDLAKYYLKEYDHITSQMRLLLKNEDIGSDTYKELFKIEKLKYCIYNMILNLKYTVGSLRMINKGLINHYLKTGDYFDAEGMHHVEDPNERLKNVIHFIEFLENNDKVFLTKKEIGHESHSFVMSVFDENTIIFIGRNKEKPTCVIMKEPLLYEVITASIENYNKPENFYQKEELHAYKEEIISKGIKQSE